MCKPPLAKMFSLQWENHMMPTDFLISVLYSLWSSSALISPYAFFFCVNVMQKYDNQIITPKEGMCSILNENAYIMQKYTKEKWKETIQILRWVPGRWKSRTLNILCLQLDIINIQVNKPESNPKTSKTNSKLNVERKPHQRDLEGQKWCCM